MDKLILCAWFCFDALQVCKTNEERREERRGVQFRADWYADIRELAEQV